MALDKQIIGGYDDDDGVADDDVDDDDDYDDDTTWYCWLEFDFGGVNFLVGDPGPGEYGVPCGGDHALQFGVEQFWWDFSLWVKGALDCHH